MKRWYLLLVIIISTLCIALTGCNKIYHWKVNGSVDEIERIEIFNYPYDDNDLSEFICEVVSENYQEIIDDIENLNFEKYYGTPKHIKGLKIKISFINGSYDLISRLEPRHCPKDASIFESRITWLYMDETEYEQLIEKWTTK